MKKLHLVAITALFIFAPLVSLAHPGRTDSSGCHTCHTNCLKWGLSTGEYHCHRAKALPQPKEPVKSHFLETGGYTTPAPEYKQPASPASKPVMEAKPKVEKVEVQPTVKKIDNKVMPEGKSNESWIIRLLKYIFG